MAKYQQWWLAWVLVWLPWLLPAGSWADGLSGAADRQFLGLTVYRDNLAVVRDVRQLKLTAGEQRVVVQDVSAALQPATVAVEIDGATVNSSSFAPGQLTYEQLLERFIGRPVRLARRYPESGEERLETGILLGYRGGLMVQLADRIEPAYPGRLLLDGDMAAAARPRLVLEISSRRERTTAMELRYCAGAIRWQADYDLILDRDQDTFAISGHALIDNRSAMDFPRAGLQLAAGRPHRVQPEPQPVALMAMEAGRAAPAAEQETVGDLALYAVPRPVTVGAHASVQVPLLSHRGVPYRKEYRLEGRERWLQSDALLTAQPAAVQVRIQFTVPEQDGSPRLPDGTARIYSKDNRGVLQLLGEDRLQQAVVGASQTLEVGAAVGLRGAVRLLEKKRLASGDRRRRTMESELEMGLYNGGERDVTVLVRQPVPGDWQMIAESMPHERDGSYATWNLELPPRGRKKISFRVRYSR